MELSEFKKNIRKVKSNRNHKVRNSLGVYDAYKYYRKNKPDDKRYILTESQYFSIIRKINNLFAKELSLGYSIKLPLRMGELELRKYDRQVYFDNNGKLHTNLPIDWDNTLELWYNDEEALKNKTLLRIDSGNNIFKLYYNKNKANYINKSYYEFTFNKDLRIMLSKNLKKGNIDAPELKRIEIW